jgi:hypothetical protein
MGDGTIYTCGERRSDTARKPTRALSILISNVVYSHSYLLTEISNGKMISKQSRSNLCKCPWSKSSEIKGTRALIGSLALTTKWD